MECMHSDLYIREYYASHESLRRSLCRSKLQDLDLSLYKDLEILSTRKGVSSLDIDQSEGRYLLSGSFCGTILLHDLVPQKEEPYTCPAVCRIRPAPGKAASISRIQWYPHDTGIFTTSGSDQMLKIWDTNALSVVERFRFKHIVHMHAVAKAKAHSLVAVGTDGNGYVTLCDLKSGSSSHILKHHRKPVLAVDWSPLSDYILASGSKDNSIFVWDIRRASGPLFSLDQHNGAQRNLSSSITTSHDGHVTGLKYTSDGLYIVSSGSDEKVKLWTAQDGKNTMVNFGKIGLLSKMVCQFAVSTYNHGSNPIICIPVNDIVMYDLEKGIKLKTLRGHFSAVHCCTFHPFLPELYSGGGESNILVWSPSRRKMRIKTAGTNKQKARRSVTLTSRSVYDDNWSGDED